MSEVCTESKTTDIVTQPVQDLLRLFSEKFSAEFHLLRLNGRPQTFPPCPTNDWQLRDFDPKRNGGKPFTLPHEDSDQIILVVPYCCGSSEFLIAGLLPQSRQADGSLALHLAEALVQGLAQQEEIEQLNSNLNLYAIQVTSNFEELCWLRQLTQSINLCEFQASITTVAQQLLPELQELLVAESLYLLPADLDEETLRSKGLFCGNRQHINSIRIAIEQFKGDAVSRPVVRNSDDEVSEIPGLPGICNLVLIRLAKANHLLGWIVAVNRLDDEFCDAPASNRGFGTLEAGLLAAAGTILSTHSFNAKLFENVEELLIGCLRTIVNTVDAKDAYTAGHSDRVALYAQMICRELGCDELQQKQVYITGLLHDVGKIGLPDNVLSKPGRLTSEEFEFIKRHPEYGVKILRHIEQLSFTLPGVLHHHEAYDGSGYPHGLEGEEIPLLARIIAVADAFDAMTSDRPYRAGMPVEEAINRLRDGSGQQWQPEVVEAFLRCETEARQTSSQAESLTQRWLNGSDDFDANDEIASAIGMAIYSIYNDNQKTCV